jgi:hypothetical protein
LNNSQFQCKNKRCIDKSLICLNEDYCGDNSHRKNNQCPTLEIGKQKLIIWCWILIIFCCCLFGCFLIICRKRRKNKDCGGVL